MRRALEGVRILDLSRLLPGPYCTMLLGDLGAEIVKVEEPRTGDPTRLTPPLIDNQGVAFRQLNRNKKSLALDLKSSEGREAFLRLAESADVILEQFRPGVVERLGVGYEPVRERNPAIVYCSLTGYGQTGPHRDRGGHDLNYIALCGLLGLTADDQGKPVIPGVQIADIAGGMMAAFAILAALLAREKSGEGRFVDVSMFDVVLSMLTIPAASHFGGVPLGIGARYGLSGAYPFYNVYRTGDGKYMTLGALEPKFWSNFCRAVGREDLISRQYDAGENRKDLFRQVAGIFASRSQAEWVAISAEADACCEPVLSLEEAFGHAQTAARRMVVESFDQPVPKLGIGCKISDSPEEVAGPAPALGEHTDEVLLDAGFTPAELDSLRRKGVIGPRNPMPPPQA